jgi:hypothetical protein
MERAAATDALTIRADRLSEYRRRRFDPARSASIDRDSVGSAVYCGAMSYHIQHGEFPLDLALLADRLAKPVKTY